MKKTNITITMLCLAAACACGDTKITWLADVTADRAETVTGVQSGQVAAAAAHIPRTDNPHGVTAAQIGAITAEQDLAALRAYHYGSPDIVESPAEWFVFDGAGTITAFNWEAGRENVVIPWAIGGVPVTTIGANAFYDADAYLGFPVTSVVAPQTVTTIGDSAFNSCELLTSVSVPQATLIGDYAFAYCYPLASVSLPQATSIGDRAFSACTVLTAVHMGQNAPAEATGVFAGINPPPTVYVTNPQATGWGAVWNGAPVVRLDLHGDKIYQAGELVATTGHVAQAIAEIPTPDLSAKVDVTAGIATNLTTRGWFALPQSEATNIVLRLVSSNEHIIVQEVYQ